MTQELFPEIQSATEALEARIAITEAEVTEMKESLRTKKDLIRAWRKALATFNPKLAAKKKKAIAGS
jgi:DNA/RNA-binding domain of Phe-tRNA-synthetase-like protein